MTENNTAHTAQVAIVTPVYNALPFVSKTYDCLCRQDFEEWEWVVVDDGSTDGTLAALRKIAERDSRVHVYTQANSGCSKYPRDRAVAESSAPLLLCLDMDDSIGDGYLTAMLNRMRDADADIVYPTMIFINGQTGAVTEKLPTDDVDTQRVYGGREMVGYTLPEWRIGCNGGLYRRAAWLNSSYPERKEPVFVYSDEVDERIYLIHAGRVAFAPEAEYYYLCYPESMTGEVGPKRFHLLRTSREMKGIIAGAFGHDSDEYRRANLKLFYSWRSSMALYVRHHRQLTLHEGYVTGALRQAYDAIEPSLLSAQDRRRFLGFCSYGLVFAIFCLKYSPRLLLRKICQRLWPSMYRYTVVRRSEEQQLLKRIAPRYATGGTPRPVCVAACDEGGGLTDRLRGAVSVFQAAEATGREFRISFNTPFDLTEYIVPAEYDWRDTAGDITNEGALPLTLADQAGTPWERRRQERWLRSQMKRHADRQLHIYTNAACCYDSGRFAADFARLFKPSPRLEASIGNTLGSIATDNYITISARFCNLLDDFNEQVFGEALSSADREALLRNAMDEVGRLRQQHPDAAVVACSDSTTFLQRARLEHGAFVIGGTVSHIGNDTPHDYAHYEKTFLDFFIISRARHAYLLMGLGMHGSGFPRAAALYGGCPFDTITF